MGNAFAPLFVSRLGASFGSNSAIWAVVLSNSVSCSFIWTLLWSVVSRIICGSPVVVSARFCVLSLVWTCTTSSTSFSSALWLCPVQTQGLPPVSPPLHQQWPHSLVLHQGHDFKRSKWTTWRCRFFEKCLILYVTSESRLITLYGSCHPLWNFRQYPCLRGIAGFQSHRSWPSWNLSPCTFLS